MSELIQNLTYIYNEKLLLKDAIGTESDDFMQYHTYVNALKPSGTSYITSNGDYDISSYSYVNVDVEGGGSGSSADPYYDYTTPGVMIDNEEESADYVSSTISENFTVTLDENDEVEAVEWDENITIDVEGTDVDKVVHVIVNGDPHDMLSTASNMESDFEDYSDLYDNVYPILENATLTASEDPSEDGYDYLLEGDLYAWNLADNSAQVEEITENGFVLNNGALGFNVDVPAQGITQGKYWFFNWLSRNDPNAGDIRIDNPLTTHIEIMNLDQLNYMDEGEETHNSYFDVYFYEDSALTTEVEFDDISDNFVGDAGGQFNLFKDLTNNDTIKYVKAEYYVWESDIDPETGTDNGTFELDDTFTGAFTNSYTITSTDEVVITIGMQNSVPVVSIFINGIAMNDSAILSVV